MEQGSLFDARVFLFRKCERQLVQRLLTEDISPDEFVQSDVLRSENSHILLPLVERIRDNWPDEIPQPYSRFIGNVCKPTSVAGYMQVTHDEPLLHLRAFCEQNLNLRSSANKEKLQLMAKELPAFWPNLMEIMELENSQYLPQEVSQIVLKLLEIRRNTFQNSAQRNDDEYIAWPSPDEEDPTQYYPNWEIFRYPKKYNVNAKNDSDFCEKSFEAKKGFAFRIFSVGCSSQHYIWL